jgi:hypothetical protein
MRTRTALVAAARRVFERDGYIDARLTDIPREANCSTGTLYTYFAGKEAIFHAARRIPRAGPVQGRGDRLPDLADAQVIATMQRRREQRVGVKGLDAAGVHRDLS